MLSIEHIFSSSYGAAGSRDHIINLPRKQVTVSFTGQSAREYRRYSVQPSYFVCGWSRVPVSARTKVYVGTENRSVSPTRLLVILSYASPDLILILPPGCATHLSLPKFYKNRMVEPVHWWLFSLSIEVFSTGQKISDLWTGMLIIFNVLRLSIDSLFDWRPQSAAVFLTVDSYSAGEEILCFCESHVFVTAFLFDSIQRLLIPVPHVRNLFLYVPFSYILNCL
jgi:hypothetical protein